MHNATNQHKITDHVYSIQKNAIMTSISICSISYSQYFLWQAFENIQPFHCKRQ